jgi:hypothetical protein
MKMSKQRRLTKGAVAALLALAVSAIVLAPAASAHSGVWAKFNNCPSTNPEVRKCMQAVTRGGKVVLGNKTVPIVNPVTLQGGVSKPYDENHNEKLFAATNGETLTKTPQPVPGGLAGLVNCKEISNFLVRLGCESVFENGLTGVNATVELALPAEKAIVNEVNLSFEEGTALQLPVKVHLENPLLGSTCYIGSSSSPIIWNLTTGTTNPPAPNKPIKGTVGNVEFLEEAAILQTTGSNLVDNAWSAPGSSGCGGFGVELILNPIINASVGVPAAAGKNTTALENTEIALARAVEVNEH